MSAIKKLFVLLTGFTVFITACNKIEDLPFYGNGNAVTLTASTNQVAPALGDSSREVVRFNWTSPNYSTDTSTYKFIVEIDSSGRNFAKKITREITGSLATGFTGRDVNGFLLNYGFAIGVPYDMDVRVVSSYGNNNERYTSNVVKLSFTPYSDPSILTADANAVVCELATASQRSLGFTWAASFVGYPGTVTYTLQYDSAGKNFANLQEIPVGATLYNKDLTQGEVNETALNVGIPGGNTGKVDYRIKATTAQGAIAYSNLFSVTIQSYVPILRFYLPGSYQSATGNGADWDPPTAPELIRDLRSSVFNDMYYTYVYLPAGALFKITQGRSWDINYGGNAGTLVAGGDNLTVPADGFYRISINRTTLKYDIREGRMGFVGGATGADWTPGNVFPSYALGAAADNLFVGITDFTAGGWKLIDNDQWNNGSNTVDETRSYGTLNGSGSTLQVNGDNFSDITTPGRYRVIWDGRDPNNIKYEMSPATEMRVVGDGIVGVPDWNPGASPQMNYDGDGVWSIIIDLKAGKDIKFLAGNDWGAFDYEDNSGQSNAVGVVKKIKWEGGDNFKTPAVAGSYTIILNEKLQTVTIN